MLPAQCIGLFAATDVSRETIGKLKLPLVLSYRVNSSAFIAEQSKLDKYLFDAFKAQCPDLLKLKYLHTQGGNPSRAKVITFLYQHEETMVMDNVRATLAEHGQTVLANIHDAICVRHKLSVHLRHEIELRMQERTDNTYWRMGSTQLKRFSKGDISTDDS